MSAGHNYSTFNYFSCSPLCYIFVILLKLKSQERQVVYEKGRVKPTGSTLDYEKTLAGIATRGGRHCY